MFIAVFALYQKLRRFDLAGLCIIISRKGEWMNILIESQEAVSQLITGIRGFREQNVFLERYSLPTNSEAVKVNFLTGLSVFCSVCGCCIGRRADGESFYEPTGYLLTINVRRRVKKQLSEITKTKVILCSTCLKIIKTQVPKLTVPATPMLALVK